MSNLGLPMASVLVKPQQVFTLIIADCIIYQDMVDTVPFSQAEPSLRADLIVKIVLGAINSTIDHGKVLPSAPRY
jgi:hypothetical protein